MLLVPGIRERGSLAVEKVLGRSSLPWSEVVIRMAPWSFQNQIRDVIGFVAPQWVAALDVPLKLDQPLRKSYRIFLGTTPNLRQLEAHLTILEGGQRAHPLLTHDDEEIIIPIVGEVDIIWQESPDPGPPRVERAGPDHVIYYPSRVPHTIAAVGPSPSTYLVLRWLNKPREFKPGTSLILYDLHETLQRRLASSEEKQRTLIFESPTHFLGRLHCHLSTARPGAGSPPHQDQHDTLLYVHTGAIKSLDKVAEAPSLVFHAARKTHSVEVVGDSPAQYLAIEFQRDAD